MANTHNNTIIFKTNDSISPCFAHNCINSAIVKECRMYRNYHHRVTYCILHAWAWIRCYEEYCASGRYPYKVVIESDLLSNPPQ